MFLLVFRNQNLFNPPRILISQGIPNSRRFLIYNIIDKATPLKFNEWTFFLYIELPLRLWPTYSSTPPSFNDETFSADFFYFGMGKYTKQAIKEMKKKNEQEKSYERNEEIESERKRIKRRFQQVSFYQ